MLPVAFLALELLHELSRYCSIVNSDNKKRHGKSDMYTGPASR